MYYVDESGFDEYYSRECGLRSPWRESYRESQRQTFCPNQSCGREERQLNSNAVCAFSGSMDGGLFEGRLEHVFAPALKNPLKSVLVLDNAPFHRKSLIYDIADEYGFKVTFLPPYLPDLNPIEKLWANIKIRLRLHMHKFANFQDALSHAFH